MLYFWLQTWRQTMLKGVLVLMILVNGVPLMSAWSSKDGLSGWWIEDQRRSGFGYLANEVVCHRMRLPEWWDKVTLGWQWAKVGLWMGLAVGLGWQSGGGSSWGWLVVIVASHQARSALAGVQKEMRVRLYGQALSKPELSPKIVSLGRVVEQAEIEPLADLPQDGQTEQHKSDQKEGRTYQPAMPAQEMGQMLAQVVEGVPIGTNLGLLHMLWMLVSGQLLFSRGALFPALQRMGLSAPAVRRAWAAFATGSWQISELLERWQVMVEQEGLWQEHCFDGYRVKAVDLTAFWRPELKHCPFKHYHPEAGQALAAMVFGVVTRVGQVGSQRVPLPTLFVRADEDNPAESNLEAQLLLLVAATLAEDELVVLDAGFHISQLQAAGVKRYTVRLAQNATARRNELPAYQGQGRYPEYGELVRPLPRSYNGTSIAATPPDRQESWNEGELSLRAEFWDNLVLPDQKPGGESFNIIAIYDPRYKDPLLLATPLALSGPTLRQIYRDRWPVEQIPLAAKQMIGAARQFVHAPESCQRLPELALFAGAILTYVAAKLPPIPTGFWDRTPKSTPGRLRRYLEGRPFFSNLPLPARIREKASVTAHLPKGILGHRRRPKTLQRV
jgi:hypothetical protein